MAMSDDDDRDNDSDGDATELKAIDHGVEMFTKHAFQDHPTKQARSCPLDDVDVGCCLFSCCSCFKCRLFRVSGATAPLFLVL